MNDVAEASTSPAPIDIADVLPEMLGLLIRAARDPNRHLSNLYGPQAGRIGDEIWRLVDRLELDVLGLADDVVMRGRRYRHDADDIAAAIDRLDVLADSLRPYVCS